VAKSRGSIAGQYAKQNGRVADRAASSAGGILTVRNRNDSGRGYEANRRFIPTRPLKNKAK